MSVQFMFGCDPEIFVKKNGKAISAHGLIPGDKKNPHKMTVGAAQVDGMAFEFNTDPVPSNDFNRFNQNIVKTIGDLRLLAKENGHDVNFAMVPVMDFEPEYLAKQPDEAKELGCDPDYNAYTLEANPRPDGDRPFRTGAGHVHIGWGADIPTDNEDHMEICAGFVRMLDATVGMFMTFIDREPRRRELYGKAGAFRPKSYGVEYRTPSNVWIVSKDRRFIMHSLMNRAIVNHTAQNGISTVTGGFDETNVQEIINTGNIALAQRVVDRLLGAQSSWDRTPATAAWERIKKDMADKLAA